MRAATVAAAVCLACGGVALTVAQARWRVFPTASVLRAAEGSGAERAVTGLHSANGVSRTTAALPGSAFGLVANGVSGTVASVPGGASGLPSNGPLASPSGSASGFHPAPWLAGSRSAGGVAEAGQTPAPPFQVERTVHLMGTWATLVALTADRGAGLRAIERMVGVIEHTEASLSTWRADSVLSALNRHPVDEAFGLPPPLCGLWPRLARWHRLTGGAFDPAVGRLVEAWGLRAGGAVPAPDALRAALAATGFARFRFDPETCRVTRVADATLDAGAFGKGEALRRLMAVSGDGRAWMVDFGGQIAVGGRPAREGWPVAVAHPARRHQPALELVLAAGSLATSGASERTWVVEGRPVAHILDPRTGRPVHRPESVTVWHADPLTADILSTALYVMGAGEGLDYAERRGVAALFLAAGPDGDGGRVTFRASRQFETRFPTVTGTPAR